MMDFHILIVISCVFLASLFSWLFISKFFRRKTFDEVQAEKKALSDKIYAQNKAAIKKPKKLQQTKKELKREKKQRQREERKDQQTTTEHDDTDTENEIKTNRNDDEIDEEPGLSKTHVEFDPDPIVLTNEVITTAQTTRRQSNAEGITNAPKQKSNKKDKKSGKSNVAAAAAAATGILLNKNEPVAIKTNINPEETLNHFEEKIPKDMVELKKAEGEKDKKEKEKERKEEKAQQQQQSIQQQQQAKKDKHSNKKEKSSTTSTTTSTATTTEQRAVESPPIVQQVAVIKEIKQLDEKGLSKRHASPKTQQQQQQNGNNSSSKNKQKKQQHKESIAHREIAQALDKLSETDTVGVQLLMNLFRHAELNRSEIQILIDYLLNKQQDTPLMHSEWSDDICQKLKRQLEEKERLLIEEQESSIGIQAKLRELRSEINNERLQMNCTLKSLNEKLQSKDQELSGLNQELQAVNEKLNLERQQFQTKLLREKQAGNQTQDLLQQLQLIQNEIVHKDKCIAELTLLVNASRQAVEESSQQRSDIIQQQAQQINVLEQQRDDLEQLANNRLFELEKMKELEQENSEIKVELKNLQNALESSKDKIAEAQNNFELVKTELATLTNNEQQQIQLLKADNVKLQQQLTLLANNKKDEQQQQQQHNKEQTAAATASMQVTLDALRLELAEKEKQLTEFATKNSELLQQNSLSIQNFSQQQKELQQRIENLQIDAANKHKQLQDVERVHSEKYTNREKELLQQLQEQREKNNDLRMKNWKLVEALQNAETKTLKEHKMLSNNKTNLVQQPQQFQVANINSSSKDEKQLRELLQRLYPDAVKATAGSALSLSFDQWIEKVLATHVKQLLATTNLSSNHKSTQSNGSSSSSNTTTTTSSNHNSSHNSHNNNNNNNNTLINDSSSRTTTNKNSTELSSSSDDRGADGGGGGGGSHSNDPVELQKENSQLRAQNEELTRLLMKTSNVLSDLEGHAREQDENWRSIVRSKDEEISALQHPNGEQGI